MEILDGIGSTEILHIFISNRPGRARAGSTGEIVPGFEARIVDDDGRDLPPGEVGTLLIKGDSIASGYWNKHETTKQTFCGEWINTYDKFMLDQDGYFWYSGRADDMLKVSGQAVWPAEVEALLQGHPAVLESGVCGAANDEGLLKPVAFVVLKDGLKPSPELARELQEFVKANTRPAQVSSGRGLRRSVAQDGHRARSSDSSCDTARPRTGCYGVPQNNKLGNYQMATKRSAVAVSSVHPGRMTRAI